MGNFQQIYIKHSVQLYDNQKVNVKKLVHRKKCILSDKTGGGKTLSVLYAFGYLKEKGYLKNMLVGCQLSAYDKQVWMMDIKKFSSFRAITLDDLFTKLNDDFSNLYKYLDYYDIIIFKHTHLKKDVMLRVLSAISAQQSTLLCIDEAHYFRNPDATMTKILKAIINVSKATWFVTATLVSVGAENIYHIVNLIKPWYLGSFVQFRDNYCTVEESVIGRLPNGQLRKVKNITGLKDPKVLQDVLEPLVISGESFFTPKHHYIDYEMDSEEQAIYTKIANGLFASPDESDPEEWFKALMNDKLDLPKRPKVGDVEKFSNRFVYLQQAAGGSIDPETGEYTRIGSTKAIRLLNLCKDITSKGQSILVYCDYLISIDILHKFLETNLRNVTILESTGSHYLKPGSVTEGTVKIKPHIILCTRASSESISYYFINNVCFYEIPTVPATAIQMVGRITRKNSLYPDDLNVYWFRSDNIDEYKLRMVSAKAKIQEDATGVVDTNIPDTYKELMTQKNSISIAKRTLLWQR